MGNRLESSICKGDSIVALADARSSGGVAAAIPVEWIKDASNGGGDKATTTAVSNPKILRRKYHYPDGDTGQLLEMKALIVDPVTSGGVVVAGSRVSYNNSLQVGDAQLLGVLSGMRHSGYTYDDRGRLAGFITAASASALPPFFDGVPKSPGAAAELPDDADFRGSQLRVPALDAATTDILTRRGINVAAIDPPGMTALPRGGHKIDSVTPSGGATRTLNYGGKSELIDDGIFLYSYDVKGRLAWAMEKAGHGGRACPPDSLQLPTAAIASSAARRRRRALPAVPVADVDAPSWQTASRSELRSQRPERERSPSSSSTARLGYDDPIQISMIDTAAPHAPGTPALVKKLYPVYDEAAGGSLQVVLSNRGEIVARSITTDPYGGARFDLSGGAIDHVEITGPKDAGGTLQSVKVAMRSTSSSHRPRSAAVRDCRSRCERRAPPDLHRDAGSRPK